MGILNAGIFGGFSNKTGPVIGKRVNGRNVVTALYHPSLAPASEGEIIQNQKFGLLNGFLKRLSPLLAIGFKHFTKKNSAYNAAFKFNYKTALILAGGQYQINYPGVVYSRGSVCKPCCLQLTTSPGFVGFSWVAEAQTQFGRVNDRASFLIYNVQKDLFLSERKAALRKDLRYDFAIPEDFEGDELHCYMNFDSENGKLTGDSVYGGAPSLSG